MTEPSNEAMNRRIRGVRAPRRPFRLVSENGRGRIVATEPTDDAATKSSQAKDKGEHDGTK